MRSAGLPGFPLWFLVVGAGVGSQIGTLGRRGEKTVS